MTVSTSKFSSTVAAPSSSSTTTTAAASSKSALRAKKEKRAAKQKNDGAVASGFTTHSLHEADEAWVGRRLILAQNTKKLDLSLSAKAASSSTPSAKWNAPVLHVIPRQLLQIEYHGEHLLELWLTNHRINSLPAEVSLFKSLRVLGIGGNTLSALPEEISQVKGLRSLYLEGNNFKSFPPTLELPRNLQHLRLDGNFFKTVPNQVLRLRELNRLGMSYNQLTALPMELKRLINLLELDLDYNQIGPEFPQAIRYLKRLERLGLEGNHLAAVPEDLRLELPQLHILRLSANRTTGHQVIDPTTSQELKGVNLYVRHDGYFQLTEGYRQLNDPQIATTAGAARGSTRPVAKLLDGVLPCKDQNLLNGTSYY